MGRNRGSSIVYALLLIVLVVIGLPYAVDIFAEFNAPTGVLGGLPAETTFMSFFWQAFPYILALGVFVVAIVIIVNSKRDRL